HGDATYLVYDLGGGTFDVSVIRRRFDDYEVLAVSGDPFLGGGEFDRLPAPPIRSQPQPDDLPLLGRVAEDIKIELSERECVREVAERLRAAGMSVRPGDALAVTRDAFQRLIKDKVHRTIDCCHEALMRAKEKAGICLSDIDYVVLVGGSS